MVFENLTLFELHMEGARFGPGMGGEEEEAGEAFEEAEVEEEESGGGRFGPGLVFLLLVVGMALGYRRFRRAGPEEEITEEAERITIEQTGEQ